ncbi:hypothetical protein DERP_013551 [Dermatophagoides pteronyssinus]|uniref:Uncharacterized protein n=1 Tax=Dermatophagoides pteronyssinus TaxID=6956 RepID=A0ABQ8J5L8_DERPT|nr:hypothetical protein DERP_013551 [Dermatophagoides pteronyssinus]
MIVYFIEARQFAARDSELELNLDSK